MILQILITLSKKYSNINNFYVILKINNTDAQPYHFYFCYSAATIIKFSTEMVITAIIKYHHYYSSFDYQNCYLSYGHCKFTTRTINAIMMISQNITCTVTTNNNDIITILHLSFQYHNYRLVSRAMLFPHTSIDSLSSISTPSSDNQALNVKSFQIL